MPRKRDRTTEKCQWSLDELERAIKRVNEDGISLHKASQECKIPYSTLQKRYRKSEQANPRLGRKPVFSSAQERILADHLIHVTNLFYGLDSIKFRKIAYQCAEQLKIPHNFNKESKCAGPDWLEGFLKRNTDISVRSSSDESDNYQNICDDNSSDYVDEDSNMCMICCESGKSNEMWYRCRSCGDWSHAQCSGSDSAKDYVCDFCIRQ